MWKKHMLGEATLPQSCTRCGAVILEDNTNKDTGAKVRDALEPQVVYVNGDDGTVAIDLPAGAPFEACSKR